MAEKKQTSTPIIRNSAGLRDAIFDEIDGIRMGSSNPTRANAVAKLATVIVDSVRMDVEVQRHLRQHAATSDKSPSIHGLGNPLQLGAE